MPQCRPHLVGRGALTQPFGGRLSSCSRALLVQQPPYDRGHGDGILTGDETGSEVRDRGSHDRLVRDARHERHGQAAGERGERGPRTAGGDHRLDPVQQLPDGSELNGTHPAGVTPPGRVRGVARRDPARRSAHSRGYARLCAWVAVHAGEERAGCRAHPPLAVFLRQAHPPRAGPERAGDRVTSRAASTLRPRGNPACGGENALVCTVASLPAPPRRPRPN